MHISQYSTSSGYCTGAAPSTSSPLPGVSVVSAAMLDFNIAFRSSYYTQEVGLKL